MDYRKYKDTVYIRMDKGDEIVGGILDICGKEKICSAVFSGIGGCSEAQIQTFIPESGSFETRTVQGMLELVSLNGNVVSDTGGLFAHTHVLFTYKDGNGAHCVAGGHIKAITVLYTAEIELRPVQGGTIGRQYDPETGTGFWSFE
jgi:predicted DNA-binding protein with PD1-like motif